MTSRSVASAKVARPNLASVISMRFTERFRRRFVLPVAVGILHCSVTPSALAQSKAAATDGAHDPKAEAAGYMRRGVDEYKKGHFELARENFARAWALTQHPAIAANLADVETRLGRYREGAEHWSFYLKNAPPDRDRSDGEEGLAECRKHVARLEVTTATKASISLDGQLVGDASLPVELWVEPGAHVVEARFAGGEVASQRLVIAAGDAQQVALAPAPEKAPVPSAAIASTQAKATAPPAVQPEAVGGGTSARTPVVIGGAALTAVALGVGVAFGLKANSASDDAESLSKKIRGVVVGNGGGGGESACESPAVLVSADCATLGSKVDAARSARTTAKVAFIAGGVLGVGTLATYLLWPRSSSSSALSFAPWHSAGVSGVLAEGSF